MAKSKAITKKQTAVAEKATPAAAPLTKKVENGSPYQLDPAQVERAATALVKNMKEHAQTKEKESGKKSLLADEDDEEEETAQSDEAIFLTLSTKQHIQDGKRLKPSKIALPHPIQANDIRICLMTADPQREFKDIVADDSFPEELRAKIGRVIDLGKLKKKYKSFESRRQLLAEYDVFLADDRIVAALPAALGKTFNDNKTKRPIPISLTTQIPKDKDGKRPRVVRKPEAIAKEIETALNATYIHLSPTASTSIKIGKLSQEPKQICENISAVVSALTEKFVPRGWRNIRGLHIKGPTTVALPIWLADELWTDETQVLDAPWKPVPGESKTADNKRKIQEWEEEMLDDDELAELRARMKKSKKNKAKEIEGGEKDTQVKSISKERRKNLKKEALKSVQTPLVAN